MRPSLKHSVFMNIVKSSMYYCYIIYVLNTLYLMLPTLDNKLFIVISSARLMLPTLEYITACPVWGSIACATPDRFVLPRCNASTRPTLLTLATVSLLMTKEVEVWGLGPPVARTLKS